MGEVEENGGDAHALGFHREEVKSRARQDLNFFSALAMPDVAFLEFPPIFLNLWEMLLGSLTKLRDFSKYAVGLPRGHGKTMFLKLLIAYIILFTDRKFILVIGATDEKAENILSDVVDILDSYNIQQVFGNWRADLEIDRKNLKKFRFNGRPVVLAAAGQGSAIRGFNIKNARPDAIILDDAQTRECALSQADSQRFLEWFLGTMMKAKSPFGCTYIYVGNMYKDMEIKPGTYGCMLRNLQLNPAWTSFIVGGILADGTALWEELQPLKQLLAEFEDDLRFGSPETFYAEVMNSPENAKNADLDLTKIGQLRIKPGSIHQGNFIIIDPATDKKKSDDTAIGYFEVYDGVPVLVKEAHKKLSSIDTVFEVLRWCMDLQCANIFVEAVQYQYELLNLFRHFSEQLGITGLRIDPLYPGGLSKNSRILAMFKALVAQELMLTPETYTPVIFQATKFDKTRRDNVDDLLDLCAYALKVMSEYRQVLVISGEGRIVHDQVMESVPSVDHFGPMF